jgi:glycosyltransferase involved in cell wall biosynthesis
MSKFLLVSCDLVKTGGMDRANYALASYLAQRGDEVHAVAHAAAADLLARPNLIFHHVPKPMGSYFLGEQLLDRAGRYWAQKLSCAGGRVMVNGGNCAWSDANWVHYVHAAYRPEVRTNWARRLKGRWSHHVFLKEERKALAQARIVVANSSRTRRDLIELLGVPESKIHTVYYGVDPERFAPASAQQRADIRKRLGWPLDQPVVAFIGALGDRRKGFDTLFSAWRRLRASGSWDGLLAVIGMGAELPLWERRAVEAGIADSIEFMGFRDDVPTVLAACDALAAPARYEAYGLGVQEALACGLPAIVSASAGVAERYGPELQDLLLVDPENAQDLAARLLAWQDRRDHFRQAVLPLCQSLRAYTWDDMARQIASLMEQQN